MQGDLLPKMTKIWSCKTAIDVNITPQNKGGRWEWEREGGREGVRERGWKRERWRSLWMAWLVCETFACLQVRLEREVLQVHQGLSEFSLLLEACPSGGASPVPAAHLSPLSHLCRGDQVWTRCHQDLHSYLAKSTHLLATLGHQANTLIFTR